MLYYRQSSELYKFINWMPVANRIKGFVDTLNLTAVLEPNGQVSIQDYFNSCGPSRDRPVFRFYRAFATDPGEI